MGFAYCCAFDLLIGLNCFAVEMLMCRLIDREFNFAEKYLKLYRFYDHGENLKRIPVPRFIEKMECDAHQIIPRLHWLDGWTLQRVENGDGKSEAFYLFSRGIWCSSFYNVVLIDDVEDEIMKHRKWEFDKKRKKWGV